MITGGTDGIGLELARIYVRRGWRVMIIGSRPANAFVDSIRERVLYCRIDLGDPDCAMTVDAFLKVNAIDGLDLLVHNAAVGWVGDFSSQSQASIRQLFSVNLCAPIRLTHALCDRLERRRGLAAFVSSVAAKLPSKDYAVYASAKAGLETFARSLRSEWRGRIDVAIVRLGAVRTGMHEKSGMHVREKTARHWPTAREAAELIVRSLDQRRSGTIGLANRIFAWVGQRFPGASSRICCARGPAIRTPGGRFAVTGAAAGIGRALCVELARRGYDLVGVDVDRGRLQAAADLIRTWGRRFDIIVADLAELESVDWLAEKINAGGNCAGVVLNAGINAVGRFESIPVAEQMKTLDVNLHSPALLVQKLLAHGLLDESGTVVFISSLAHFVGYPGAATYAAGKSALSSLAWSLGVRLRRSGGQALAVFPGPTRTEHARRYSPDNSRENRRMAPERLAKLTVDAIEARRPILIPGWSNRLAALAGAWFPELTTQAMRAGLFTDIVKSVSSRNGEQRTCP